MRFEVTILGNGSASPSVTRHPSAHALNVREQFFLIDCGEGTQERLLRAGVSPLKLNAVFISHIHGDHIFGLIPLMASLAMAGKQTPLQISGPPALERLLDFFTRDFGLQLSFPLQFTPIDTTKHRLVHENTSMEVWSVPLRHRVPATGYLFREKQDPVGTIPRSYAYLSDTMPSAKAAELIQGVDLLYHEATFADTERHLARKTGHSTATQAAKIALKAGAGKLLLGHFSTRYKDLELIQNEARTIFPETYIATEGTTFGIPVVKK